MPSDQGSAPFEKTVVLIHGAWMTPGCWDRFRGRFEAAGYRVLTPTWPLMDRPAEELRRAPAPGFGAMTVGRITDHHAAIIRALPAPPFIVGHSFGGLVAQLLLDQGLGAAGAAIDPAPFKGLIPDLVSLGAATPVLLRWGAWWQPFMLSRAAFDARFANTAPAALRETEYARLVVPAPGKIFLQAALGAGLAVHPKSRRQPLLFTSASEDRTVAPPLVRMAYQRQSASPAKTELADFPGLSHFLIAEPGWEAVADRIIGWHAAL